MQTPTSPFCKKPKPSSRDCNNPLCRSLLQLWSMPKVRTAKSHRNFTWWETSNLIRILLEENGFFVALYSDFGCEVRRWAKSCCASRYRIQSFQCCSSLWRTLPTRM
jgi:hypothetical protein